MNASYKDESERIADIKDSVAKRFFFWPAGSISSVGEDCEQDL